MISPQLWGKTGQKWYIPSQQGTNLFRSFASVCYSMCTFFKVDSISIQCSSSIERYVFFIFKLAIPTQKKPEKVCPACMYLLHCYQRQTWNPPDNSFLYAHMLHDKFFYSFSQSFIFPIEQALGNKSNRTHNWISYVTRSSFLKFWASQNHPEIRVHYFFLIRQARNIVISYNNCHITQ